jgi:hypothetical protein
MLKGGISIMSIVVLPSKPAKEKKVKGSTVIPISVDVG